MKEIDPKFVDDLDAREPAADPDDADRKRRLENELFVLQSRRTYPVGGKHGWFVIGPSGRIHRVKC